jgi:hypothetical protein
MRIRAAVLTVISLAVVLPAPAAKKPSGDGHWAFQPVSSPSVPAVRESAWPRHAIDSFILAELEKKGLPPSAEADPGSWLRRVSLDLTGLPPSPDEVTAFLAAVADAEQREAAYAAAVDRLLASPHYGERQAQHWLDLVRYADTHGFEVNTERPNAWPYRDYVIRAFNDDRPYDRFLHEQIAGTGPEGDAATGFLLTASVLLPGQIGKDEPSIRLARQDSLDEIVVNISQTFLGLSVGCARCHDHKFDPVSQREYFAMQAFVAGVEYEDRELRTPEAMAGRAKADALRSRIGEIDNQLGTFAPLAQPGRVSLPPPDPRGESAEFPATEAVAVRFSIHDANLHPALGLIEPCLDEFEVFTAAEPAVNAALASHGAVAGAAGSKESERHRLAHLNDGQYGNDRSWMSDAIGTGQITISFPQPTHVSRAAWSRDRLGQLTDRLPTAWTLEVCGRDGSWRTVAERRPLRPAVNPRANTDRFASVTAQQLRFVITATNSLEPCLDEVEVFSTQNVNVARAAGITTGSDSTVPGRHERAFLNDGLPGNEHSWISGEQGKGTVVLTFPEPVEIDRVVWGRDRTGKFEDRLPTEYRIEIRDGDGWRTVADSADRRPFVAGMDSGPAFTVAGLPPEDKAAALALLAQKKEAEGALREVQGGQLVFGGKFRQPDRIHVLRRGDPEQPMDETGPAAPAVLGSLALEPATPEADRRVALANWLAQPSHPLTARVMVNRLWQSHFGTGIVSTPSDFGLAGSPPSHPALLDWLAGEFVRNGWSVKAMHRLMVLSAAYRQASSVLANPAGEAALRVDADVRLLWRYPNRRMEAESLRDTMLAAAGLLNPAMFGRGYDLFDQRGGLSGFQPIESFSGDGLRRMVYAHKIRREREAVFGAFDCPDAGQSTDRRRESTTPIQALNLFNSRFTAETAAALAARLERECPTDADARIRRLFLLCLGRAPSAVEAAAIRATLAESSLVNVCRTMLNANAFVFWP